MQNRAGLILNIYVTSCWPLHPLNQGDSIGLISTCAALWPQPFWQFLSYLVAIFFFSGASYQNMVFYSHQKQYEAPKSQKINWIYVQVCDKNLRHFWQIQSPSVCMTNFWLLGLDGDSYQKYVLYESGASWLAVYIPCPKQALRSKNLRFKSVISFT